MNEQKKAFIYGSSPQKTLSSFILHQFDGNYYGGHTLWIYIMQFCQLKKKVQHNSANIKASLLSL